MKAPKKTLQLVTWNTMKQGKLKNNHWFISDTFYPLVAEAFKTKQTLHRICNLGGFLKETRKGQKRLSPTVITVGFGGRRLYLRS